MWEPGGTSVDVEGGALEDFILPSSPSAWNAPVSTMTTPESWSWTTRPEEIWPAPPRRPEDLGLSVAMLHDLIVKIMFFAGTCTAEELAERTGLPFNIVESFIDDLKAEHLLEVASGASLNDYHFRYRLTSRGDQRANDALARSRYASVAPVTLDEYAAIARKQSMRAIPTPPGRILEALSELVLRPETVDGLARALHSGRSTLIFGPSGNGKTSILEHYANYSNDTVIIPYALYIHGQLIRVFDKAVHQPVQVEPEAVDDYGLFKPQARTAKFDQRWVLVRRPVVVVGGELTQEGLELSFDPVAKFYQAPPHLKAQDGMFVIDDFGRQRVRPEELLNRWILPMERGFDLLTLHTGESFTVPFEMALMFSTNLRPADLVDEAFLRRIPYKIEIPSPRKPEFREISKRILASKRLSYTEDELDAFVDLVYAIPDREPKGAYPRDLVQIILDATRFDGTEPRLSRMHVERALQVYFIE